MKADFLIYTDGGARGNPGVAGAGAIIKDGAGKILKKIAKPLGHQTNNFAEYTAVLVALEELKKIVPKEKRKEVSVEIRMDSELVMRQLSGRYQIKEESLFPFFIKIHNLKVSEFPHLTFIHIPREENGEADALSNEAMDAQSSQGLFRKQ